MSSTFRIGPARIFIADSYDDVLSNWKEIGVSRGNTVVSLKYGDKALGRTDQALRPVTDAVYLAPASSVTRFLMSDRTVEKLIELYPSAVKLSSGAKEALTVSKLAPLTPKAVAIAPIDEVASGDPFVGADSGVFYQKALIRIGDSVTVANAITDTDDALSDTAFEVTIEQVGPGTYGIGPALLTGDNWQGAQFAWQPSLDGLVPHIRDSRTFSRASTGTYVDAQGVLRTAAINEPRYDGATGRPINEPQRTNLLTYSNYNAGPWTTANGPTVTTGQADPSGGTDAVLVEDNSASFERIQSPLATVSVGQMYTASVYVKKDPAATYACLVSVQLLGSSPEYGYLFIDPSDGTFSNVGSPNDIIIYSAVEDIGDWYRCVIVVDNQTSGNTSAQIILYPAGGQVSTGVDNNAVGTATFAHSQIEAGSFATSYIPTSGSTVTRSADVWGGSGTFTRATTATYIESGLVKYAGSGQERYQDGGLLLEPQRTNLLTYSEAFDNAAWTKSGTTVVVNDATAPDGTATADRVYPATSGNSATRFVLQQATAASAVYTASIFVKQAGKTAVAFYGADGTMLACYVNLLTGVASNVAGSYTVSVTDIGSDWYRVAITSPTATNPYLIAAAVDAVGSTTVTASGTNGIFVWGAGIEAGSYPTSYIPTSGASATRNADALTIPFTTGLPTTAMSVLWKGIPKAAPDSADIGVRLGASVATDSDEFKLVPISGGVIFANPSASGDVTATGGPTFANGTEDDIVANVSVSGDTVRTYNGSDVAQSTAAIAATATHDAADDVIARNTSAIACVLTGMLIVDGTLTPAQIRKYLR